MDIDSSLALIRCITTHVVLKQLATRTTDFPQPTTYCLRGRTRTDHPCNDKALNMFITFCRITSRYVTLCLITPGCTIRRVARHRPRTTEQWRSGRFVNMLTLQGTLSLPDAPTAFFIHVRAIVRMNQQQQFCVAIIWAYNNVVGLSQS